MSDEYPEGTRFGRDMLSMTESETDEMCDRTEDRAEDRLFGREVWAHELMLMTTLTMANPLVHIAAVMVSVLSELIGT